MKLTKTQVRAIVGVLLAVYAVCETFGVQMPPWLLGIVALLGQELGIAVPTVANVDKTCDE